MSDDVLCANIILTPEGKHKGRVTFSSCAKIISVRIVCDFFHQQIDMWKHRDANQGAESDQLKRRSRPLYETDNPISGTASTSLKISPMIED